MTAPATTATTHEDLKQRLDRMPQRPEHCAANSRVGQAVKRRDRASEDYGLVERRRKQVAELLQRHEDTLKWADETADFFTLATSLAARETCTKVLRELNDRLKDLAVPDQDARSALDQAWGGAVGKMREAESIIRPLTGKYLNQYEVQAVADKVNPILKAVEAFTGPWT